MRESFFEAEAYDTRNRFAEAGERYTSLIDALASAQTSSNNVLALICRDRCAVMLMCRWRYEQAAELCHAAWWGMVQCKDLGPSHESTQTCAGNFAQILRYLGEPDRAQDVLEASFEMASTEPLESTTGIWLLSLYAHTLLDQGDFDECQIRLRDVVRACHLTAELGREGVFTLHREADTAAAILKDDRSDEITRKRDCAVAEKILRRSHNSLVRLLGARHPEALQVARDLGDALRLQGKLNDSSRILTQTLASQRTVYGSLHPDILLTTSSLALIMHAQGKVDDAAETLDFVRLEQEAFLGTHHPDTRFTTRSCNALRQRKRARISQSHIDTHGDAGDIDALQASDALNLSNAGQLLEHASQRNMRKMSNETSAYASQMDWPVASPTSLQPVKSSTARWPSLTSAFARSTKRSDISRKMRRAASRGNRTEVQRLARSFPGAIHSEGGLWETPLAAACKANDLPLVQWLLKRHVNVDARNGAALRNAARRGHKGIVRELVESAKADKELGHAKLSTAIRAALAGGHAEVFHYLQENGASVDLEANQDVLFGSPLQRAVVDGQATIIAFLLDEGADPSEQKGYFGSALEIAAFLQRSQILTDILSHSDRIEPAALRKALTQAIMTGHQSMVDSFLPGKTVSISWRCALASV